MQLLFPYPQIRAHQDKLIEDMLQVIQDRCSALVSAPTGLGKTVSTLAPALAYTLDNKKELTIFFCTSRHTQHKIAIETLKAIQKKFNVDFSVIDLIGKRWMCAQEDIEQFGASEFSDWCRDLIEKGQCEFYSRIKRKKGLSGEARQTLKELEEQKILNAEEVKAMCIKAELCPFEISCVLARKAKVIICDYNHLLNSSIRDILFSKIGKDLSKSIIIADEAHTLPDRIRKLFSQQISTISLQLASREANRLGYEDAAEHLKTIGKLLEQLSKEKIPIDKIETLTEQVEFVKQINNIANYEELINNFLLIGQQVLEQKERSYTANVAVFLKAWQGPDQGFTRILRREFTKIGKPNTLLTYQCLDPSPLIQDIASKCPSIIFMSGTLLPLEMYRDLFGFGDNIKLLSYGSPFPKTNKLRLIVPKTTTKYDQRDDKMYEEIAANCAAIINAVPGNSIIFFPSYNIRDDVAVHFRRGCTKPLILEQRQLTKESKSELLEDFKSYKDEGAVLLATSNGNFGQGIDLPGDFLKAVIVVGLPLTTPDLETQELIKYYESKFGKGKGWDYGYKLPAFIKCMQNAGRCIRSETDKGLIVFLDKRYIWPNYHGCFPNSEIIQIEKEPVDLIKKFF